MCIFVAKQSKNNIIIIEIIITMDKETIDKLESEVLKGDASAMVKMAKYLLGGGEHPYLDAKLLLESATEAGSSEAAMLLKLIDWEKQPSRNREASIHKETENQESNSSEEVISEDNLETEDNAMSFDDEIEDIDSEEDKIDVLLRAQALYRSWRDRYNLTGQDSGDREEAIRLFEEAVAEYEEGHRRMDDDLLEALVLIAQYYSESADNNEKYLKYVKLGADNGQATLAYMYGQHLRFTDRKIEDAEQYYKKALDGEFTRIRARMALAMIYLQTKGFFQAHKEDALRYIEEGLHELEKQGTISPEEYILYLLKGDYWRLSNKTSKACEVYKAALKVLLNSDNAPKELAVVACGNLAGLYSMAGNHREANKYKLKKKELLQQL